VGEFAGKTVVVTGGGQGIGRAVAAAFAARGARIVLAEADRARGEDAAAELAEAGHDVLFHETDVADPESVRAMVAAALARFGSVDVLVNNAGIGGPGILSGTLDDWDRVLAVNLRGAYLTARAVREPMRRAGGGAIVNIASTRALMSEPDSEPYAASKGGLLALTHALAISLGPDRIRVNAICPGWIETSRWRPRGARGEPDLRPEDHAQHPVGRVGQPEDVAEAAVFLASPRAGFITGQYLVVDGGMTVKMIYV
jgi:NAD(P)-dependent dehydrogenase (short-subunit alcohol dehydrogenase family)